MQDNPPLDDRIPEPGELILIRNPPSGDQYPYRVCPHVGYPIEVRSVLYPLFVYGFPRAPETNGYAGDLSKLDWIKCPEDYWLALKANASFTSDPLVHGMHPEYPDTSGGHGDSDEGIVPPIVE